MDDLIGTLVSWSEFLLLHVLPIAVSQIYDWIREWQILFATLIVLIFFHAWSRSILRAARQAAKETVQTETRAFQASLKLLKRQIEARPESPKSVRDPAPRIVESAPKEPARPVLDDQTAVERLRQAIRLALGTLPTSDEPLAPGSLRLYRAAIDTLNDMGTAPEGRGHVLEQIQSELAALKEGYPPQSCRQAWQSLVKINTLAREFHQPPLTRAEVLAAGTRATP